MIFHHSGILTGHRELAAECERFYLDSFGMGIAYAGVTENSDYSFYADNLNPAICLFEIIGKSFDEREANFLSKYGPGLDHICFIVEDLGAVFENMSADGVKFHVTPYQYENFMCQYFLGRSSPAKISRRTHVSCLQGGGQRLYPCGGIRVR